MNAGNSRALTNIQTGNTALLTLLPDGIGYVYTEHARYIIIQAQPDVDGTYLASAHHIFEGKIGEVNDCSCLDDALAELEYLYGDQIRRWCCPQTLGV